MFSEEEYFINIEKEKREKVAEIGNNLITYLQNSFTGKIAANKEIVDVFITAFYKDVNKEEMSELVLLYLQKIDNL